MIVEDFIEIYIIYQQTVTILWWPRAQNKLKLQNCKKIQTNWNKNTESIQVYCEVFFFICWIIKIILKIPYIYKKTCE